MNCVLIFFLSLFGHSFCTVSFADQSTLRFVHLLWRHGDRSPAKETFPTDTDNPESSWPQGWGELTTLGMKQQYQLGQYLRQRYDGYLSSAYSKYEIYIRSTEYNRTIMSAMANMAGLYPPSGEQVWDEHLLWQPVPVHSWPKDEDRVLRTSYPCPRADALWQKEVGDSFAFKTLMKKNEKMVDRLRNLTGLPLELGFYNSWQVYDPINCERRHSDTHTVPDWASEDLFAEIKQMYTQSMSYYFYARNVLRVRSGLLLNDIIARMQQRTMNATDNLDSRMKIYAYSAHDTTVTAFLQALGAFNNALPPYAACVIVELHFRNNRYEIEVWYRNSTDAPYALQVGNCDNPCTLDKFVARSKPYIPDDFERECNYRGPWWPITTYVYSVIVTVICVVLMVLLGVVTTVVVVLWAKERRREFGNGFAPISQIDSAAPDDDESNLLN